MKRNLFQTHDGSYTLHLPEWNEQYHSKHGAVAESKHVFLKEGLEFWLSQNKKLHIAILEIGFGTGLNALLTLLDTEDTGLVVDYTAIEAYPLSVSEIEPLAFPEFLNVPKEKYLQLHRSAWEQKTAVSQDFYLTKRQIYFSDIAFQNQFDLIYFDAFGVRVQPELWTEPIFMKMYQSLKPQGVLVTYASNGNARRALQAVGFTIYKIPGPPGKREMMRALKN